MPCRTSMSGPCRYLFVFDVLDRSKTWVWLTLRVHTRSACGRCVRSYRIRIKRGHLPCSPVVNRPHPLTLTSSPLWPRNYIHYHCVLLLDRKSAVLNSRQPRPCRLNTIPTWIKWVCLKDGLNWPLLMNVMWCGSIEHWWNNKDKEIVIELTDRKYNICKRLLYRSVTDTFLTSIKC